MAPWTAALLLLLHCGVGISLPAPTNVSITSVNLEHTLHFLPGSETPGHTHFRIQVMKVRRKSVWKPADRCSSLEPGQNCELTGLMKDPWACYQARAQAYSPAGSTSDWATSGLFQPMTHFASTSSLELALCAGISRAGTLVLVCRMGPGAVRRMGNDLGSSWQVSEQASGDDGQQVLLLFRCQMGDGGILLASNLNENLAGLVLRLVTMDAADLDYAQRKAREHDWHILHKTTETAAPLRRLKSRHPYNKAAQELLRSTTEDLSKDGWLAAAWKQEWERAGPTQIHHYILDPGDGATGDDLPRRQWTLLNRLRTGVAAVGPPDVSVAGCGNCLVLQVRPLTSRWQQLERYRHMLLSVRRTRDGVQFHMSVDYEEKTVIGYLEPGVEYCVMVSMVAFIKQKSAPVKYCAFTSPPRNNSSVLLVLLGASGLLAAALVGFLVLRRRLQAGPHAPGTRDPEGVRLGPWKPLLVVVVVEDV
ncbi:unnamed protein product [Arctogadus glacialis]